MFDYSKFAKLDVSKIDAHIKRLAAGYVKLKEQSHLVLIACMEHGMANKDFSKLTTLFNSLPDNANKRGMMIWLDAFTSARWMKNKEGTEMFLSRNADGQKVEPFILEAGYATPFYDMPKVKAQNKTFSFEEALAALLSKAKSKKEKGELPEREAILLDTIAVDVTKFLEKNPKPVEAATQA